MTAAPALTFAKMQSRHARLSGALAIGFMLAACSSAPTDKGEVHGESFRSSELVQSDSNRMATLAMKENLESLYLLMDKLYRRNPGEWKKAAASREEAMSNVRIAVTGRQPELARKAAADHVDSVRQSLAEIEQEEQRLVRATLRLEGWT